MIPAPLLFFCPCIPSSCISCVSFSNFQHERGALIASFLTLACVPSHAIFKLTTRRGSNPSIRNWENRKRVRGSVKILMIERYEKIFNRFLTHFEIAELKWRLELAVTEKTVVWNCLHCRWYIWKKCFFSFMVVKKVIKKIVWKLINWTLKLIKVKVKKGNNISQWSMRFVMQISVIQNRECDD